MRKQAVMTAAQVRAEYIRWYREKQSEYPHEFTVYHYNELWRKFPHLKPDQIESWLGAEHASIPLNPGERTFMFEQVEDLMAFKKEVWKCRAHMGE